MKRMRSITPFMRAARMDTKLATAPSRKAGATTCEMICDSWLIDPGTNSMGKPSVIPRVLVVAERIMPPLRLY